MGADDKSHIRVGKLNLVDLAGSERQSKTGAAVRNSVAKPKDLRLTTRLTLLFSKFNRELA